MCLCLTNQFAGSTMGRHVQAAGEIALGALYAARDSEAGQDIGRQVVQAGQAAKEGAQAALGAVQAAVDAARSSRTVDGAVSKLFRSGSLRTAHSVISAISKVHPSQLVFVQ